MLNSFRAMVMKVRKNLLQIALQHLKMQQRRVLRSYFDPKGEYSGFFSFNCFLQTTHAFRSPSFPGLPSSLLTNQGWVEVEEYCEIS